MPTDLISVILPVHNGAATVAAAIDTCLQQTHRSLELLVINDGSTDATPAILTDEAKRDPRLRVVHLPTRRGVATAFQAGLDRAQGQWIARMDADDLNHPERLSKQLALMRARPSLDAASCLVDIRKREDDGELRSPDEGYRRFADWLNHLVEPDAIWAQRFVDQPIVNPTLFMRRRVMQELKAYRAGLAWAEDYDFWLRFFEGGKAIAKVPETLYTWTDHPRRLTRTDAAYTQRAFIRCKAHYLSHLPLVHERGVSICGAGPIGKRLGRALNDFGAPLRCYYEVNPRRIGETIHGIPVLSMEEWHPIEKNSPVVLSAVGQPGKRAHVRALALARGHREGVDYFATA